MGSVPREEYSCALFWKGCLRTRIQASCKLRWHDGLVDGLSPSEGSKRSMGFSDPPEGEESVSCPLEEELVKSPLVSESTERLQELVRISDSSTCVGSDRDL